MQATQALASVNVIHAFSATGQQGDPNDEGQRPTSDLVQGDDGAFYGTTGMTWSNSQYTFSSYEGDVAFKVTTSGQYTVLAHFGFDSEVGSNPSRHLEKGTDGNFYGTTSEGGGGSGCVFKMTPSGTLSVMAPFQGSTIGRRPGSGVVQASDGNFYGVSQGYYTDYDPDVIFKMTPSGTLTKLASFPTDQLDVRVFDRLVQGPDGNLWGCTSQGGSSHKGSVFKVSLSGTLTTVVNFDGSNGEAPQGGLIAGSDGNLYGTTRGDDSPAPGDSSHIGTVFRLTTSGTLTTLFEFKDAPYGAYPVGRLVQGPDGNLYGSTMRDSLNDTGSVFRLSLSGEFTEIARFPGSSFSNSPAAWPCGGLVFASSTQLLGTTLHGGQREVGEGVTYLGKGTVYSLDISGFASSPAIAVEAPAGTGLTSGSSTVTYGSVPTGGSSSKTFVIKNTGAGNLNVSGISVSGGNASDFTVSTTGMSSTVSPGSQTTFTVTATPGAVGARSTTLRVASDDPTTATFSIGLSATGVVPAPIAFKVASYQVNQGATTVTLDLTRTNKTVAQSVTINTDDGETTAFPPFSPAVAGTDYVDLAGTKTTVNFAVGALTAKSTITLKALTGAQPNRVLTATLSNPTNGATLGTISTATIKILATDTTAPTLTLSSPTFTSLDATTQETVATIAGWADDDHGISRVEVLHNTFPKAAVTFTNDTNHSPSRVTFNHDVSLVIGANKLEVRAYDLRGVMKSEVRTITVSGGQTLSITRTVPDAYATKADTVGTVAMVVTPSQKASALAPTTANAITRTCLVLPGAPVTLTATAKTGFVFSHWTGYPEGATVTGNVLSFNMTSPPTTMPSISAVFIANVFAGSTQMGSAFNGLIHPDQGGASNYHTEGFFVGTLEGSTGAFTGKLYLDGLSTTITAIFYGDGNAVFKIGSTSLYSKTLLLGARTVTMSYDLVSRNSISVQVTDTDGPNTCSGIARRAYYSSSRKVNSSLLNQTTKGFYTFVIPSKTQTPTMNIHLYPQGYGMGTITLTNTGVVMVSGTLADGTSVTCSSSMDDAGTVPFFAQFAVAGVSQGCISGVLNFDRSPIATDVSATNMLWIRPASSMPLYTSGWPAGIKVDLSGALYSTTATAQTSLALGTVNLVNGNAALDFDEGPLTSPIAITAFNINGNVATPLVSTDKSFGLGISASTGGFTGSFLPNWTPRSNTNPTFRGTILQKGSMKGGYGYFISNKPGDNDPESGLVELGAQ